MDAYHKCRGLKSSNRDLEVYSGFHFPMQEGLQLLERKSSNNIIHESIDTDTLACGICHWKWRQAQDIISLIEECINVNTIIIDIFQALEKRNSDTSRN